LGFATLGLFIAAMIPISWIMIGQIVELMREG
jgi:hypothetical protein